jgi:hypothetical protein
MWMNGPIGVAVGSRKEPRPERFEQILLHVVAGRIEVVHGVILL